MSGLCCAFPSRIFVRDNGALLLAAAFLLAGSAVANSQSVPPAATTSSTTQPSGTTHAGLPNAPPSSASTGASAGLQPASGPDGKTDPFGQTTPDGQDAPGSRSAFRPRSGASSPFKIPRSISKTTSNGLKFQLSLPRLALGTGQRSMGSPLDSAGTRSMGGGNFSMLPSDGGSTLPADPSSSGIFDTSSTRMARGGFGGGGAGGGSAGGLSISAPGKSSMFDLHLSMNDLMGRSISEGAGGGSSAGSGLFGAGGSGMAGAGGAADFGGAAGGGRGADRGAGPKLSLGLRF